MINNAMFCVYMFQRFFSMILIFLEMMNPLFKIFIKAIILTFGFYLIFFKIKFANVISVKLVLT